MRTTFLSDENKRKFYLDGKWLILSLGMKNLSLGVSLPYPMAEVAKEGCIFDFFTGVNELSLQIIPIPVNCSSSGEVGTESPFSRSLLHWPIQQAAMANTASSIGHHSQLCEKGQF